MRKVLALWAALSALCIVSAADAGNAPPVSPVVATITASVTRPNDTNAYSANDTLADSTSTPTVGGFTFASACALANESGTILDAAISESAKTALQGEIWIFDQAVTAVNDNAAFNVSNTDVLHLVGVIPFNTVDTNSTNAISYVNGLNFGYTCVGSTNLRFLVKVMNAPTPGASEVLSIRLHVSN